MQRACPGRFARKMGCTRSLKNAKSKTTAGAGPDALAEAEPVRAQAAIVCHSALSWDAQNLPPVWVGSPPASGASGCRKSGLLPGSPGTTKRDATAKLARDWASVHDLAPSASGCRRKRLAIFVWQVKQAFPLPSFSCRGLRKIGSTRVL